MTSAPCTRSSLAGSPFAAAVLPPAHPLPEPWYSADHRGLACQLCGDDVDELWPLADYPHDPDAVLSPGELCVCRRCVEAIRPVERHHPTSHRPAA